ncbi:hypothetical protein [Amycolatopsis saalfeldensis]|uniref:Uncharacterized protein n=1 Tax=Amycolatopsis saalfeldensis TaxID=394193 RepID=A0A1H8YAJ9_9PSEU|nr:hypothetical protein [Amycolatopsis saalfeldensis]SEP49290.1 hypothetical protein SAMN04489732_1132 [Amycolatopsis saalfeldensis]
MSSARGELAALAVDRLAGRAVYSGDLVDAGGRALVEGVDSPSLPELAGLGRDDADAPDVFARVVHELGIELPADATAARWQLLGESLGAMVRGEATPAKSSGPVVEFDRLLGYPGVLRELVRWFAMLDAWIPTDVTPVSFCEQQILEQARLVLAGPWPPVTR